MWLNGGVRFEYFRPVRIGGRLSAVTRLVDVYENRGGLGSLLFTITKTTFEDEKEELACKIHGIIIRR